MLLIEESIQLKLPTLVSLMLSKITLSNVKFGKELCFKLPFCTMTPSSPCHFHHLIYILKIGSLFRLVELMELQFLFCPSKLCAV